VVYIGTDILFDKTRPLYETIEAIVGREEAMRTKLLRWSIDWTPPESQLEGELPIDEEFYDGEVPEWVPSDRSESDDESSRV
jgi:hypothetical protein